MEISKKDIENLTRVKRSVLLSMNEAYVTSEIRKEMEECIESLDKAINELDYRLHTWETV